MKQYHHKRDEVMKDSRDVAYDDLDKFEDAEQEYPSWRVGPPARQNLNLKAKPFRQAEYIEKKPLTEKEETEQSFAKSTRIFKPPGRNAVIEPSDAEIPI